MFIEDLKTQLINILKELQLEIPSDKILFEHPALLEHGDYSTNIALKLKPQISKIKTEDKNLNLNNPLELANLIVNKWNEKLPEYIEKIEVANNGFINIWLNFKYFVNQIDEVITKADSYGKSEAKNKKIVIDYSAPNIAKSFGIGHLRSTNIGQAIYNLYKYLGWETIGENHLGDWGTQFGRLICQIEIKNQSAKIKNNELTIDDLEKLYVEFHQDLEKDPTLEDKAREWFKKLEEGDKEAIEIWEKCKEISLKEFDRVYDLLGIKIDFAHGESFYQDKMQSIIDLAKEKKLAYESDGALVMDIPGENIPLMLQKTNGTTTYATRDLSAVKYRVETWNPDLIVYEVGSDQNFHLKQIFEASQLLGLIDKNKLVHVSHGLFRFKDGKFSTRKGTTVHLQEILDEAIKRAKELKDANVGAQLPVRPLADDAPDTETQNVPADIAQIVGIGAVKYNDLKQNPKTEIIFDWEQMISLSGNSGPYLQYTYARIQSVFRKIQGAGNNEQGIVKPREGNDVSDEETLLLRTFYRFPEVIEEAAEEFSPNILCNFLFDLAQKFNNFYDKQKIIGSDNEEFRLVLAKTVDQVLKNGLTILGIQTVEKM